MDGLVGVGTLGSLARQHDAVRTVSDGVADVANLGTSGPGVLDHALEHLSGADDGLAGNVAHGNHLLLGGEHLGGGNLDAQIATGYHDTVGLLQDLGKVVETLSVLNLGNDLDVLAVLAQNLTDGLDVLGTTDERGKDHVDIVLDAKSQVVLVLLGQGRQVNIGVGQVDALPRRDEAVVLGLDAEGLVVDNVQDLESQDAVVDVNDTTLLDHLGDVLVVDIHVLGVTSSLIFLIGGDVQLGTSREGKISIAGGVTGSDFLFTPVLLVATLLEAGVPGFFFFFITYGSLGVQSNSDLATRLSFLGGAGIVDDRLVVLVLALIIRVSHRPKSVEQVFGDIRGRSS